MFVHLYAWVRAAGKDLLRLFDHAGIQKRSMRMEINRSLLFLSPIYGLDLHQIVLKECVYTQKLSVFGHHQRFGVAHAITQGSRASVLLNAALIKLVVQK